MIIKINLQTAYSKNDMPTLNDFKKWASETLRGRTNKNELTIRIVDEQESEQLNKQYRLKSGPTNILSFPYEDLPNVKNNLIGDLVICAPLVEQEANKYKKTSQAHWAHLTIHGCLHLLGYDHIKESDSQLMESVEISLLKKLGFKDPYAV